MIVCSCRRISNHNYTPEQLKKRLNEKDVKCGKCIKQDKK